MVFSSPIFICVFLPLVLGLYYLLPKATNNAVLVAASLVFYAWGDPLAAVALIIPSVTINFFLGRIVGAAAGQRRRYAIAGAVTFNLAVLIVFKYWGFVVSNVNPLLGAIGAPSLPAPEINLPLGISFFTFHIISYLVDVYRGILPPQASLAAFALYIVNFPQLIAGPIIRYRQMAGQLGARVVAFGDIEYGVLRFTTGLAKKLLLADPIGEIADAVFGIPAADLTTGAAWLGVACYTLQIYFDFSGYSDMAIGLARMFGFRFPENFNYPYAANSIQDFWRRWHMTLSAWFRDYVYLPLGGNRFGPWHTVRNLWIVFLLTGAWHGASWNFIVWGLWHGLFLSLEKIGAVARLLERLPQVIRVSYVLAVVMLGWVFFRASDLGYAIAFLRRMFALDAGYALPVAALNLVTWRTLAMMALAACLALPVWPLVKQFWWKRIEEQRAIMADVARAGFVALVLVLSFATMASQQASQFLYFRF
jgi:alginate O-acetyltransferase complex protein AlgI